MCTSSAGIELDWRKINGLEMTLRGPASVQMLPTDTPLSLPFTAILPVTQSDGVVTLPAERLPTYPMHVQVMTDEQLQTLRRQISVYATICQQLVEMHKAIMAQQHAIPGLRLGHCMPNDPAIHTTGHKLTSRQRWTPSQTQLQILERLFQQGNGTPNKQRIKEITADLSQHGQISETNVYNWFQNRRARTKRRQQLGLPNNGESDVDTDGDSPKEKRAKTERDVSHESFGARNNEMNYQGCEGGVLIAQSSDQIDLKKQFTTGKMLAQVDFNCPNHVNRVVTSVELGFASGGLQDSQGQIITKFGAKEPLTLVHEGKNYALAGLENVLVTTPAIPSVTQRLQQVSATAREGDESLGCSQSQSPSCG